MPTTSTHKTQSTPATRLSKRRYAATMPQCVKNKQKRLRAAQTAARKALHHHHGLPYEGITLDKVIEKIQPLGFTPTDGSKWVQIHEWLLDRGETEPLD